MTVSSTLSATPPGTETTRLQVRVYDSLESMEFLRPAWDKLLAEVPTSSTFSTWEWLAAWWRAFGQGQELRFVAFFDAREELTGIAALAVKDHTVVRGCRLRLLRLMGDGSGDSDNLDVIARPGFEDAVADAFLQYLESSRRSWDFCALNTLPSYSPAAQSLLQRLQLRSWPYFTSQPIGSPIASSSVTTSAVNSASICAGWKENTKCVSTRPPSLIWTHACGPFSIFTRSAG